MESDAISQQEAACKNTCSTVAYQEVAVSVPVTVHPFANYDEITVSCAGEPTIEPNHKCTENGNCRFTITQKLYVSIPIEFGANACIGDPGIICGHPNTEGCSDCTQAKDVTDLPFALRMFTYFLKAFLRS